MIHSTYSVCRNIYELHCYVWTPVSIRHLLIGYDYKSKWYLVMDLLISQQ